jgi:hypothetical protein
LQPMAPFANAHTAKDGALSENTGIVRYNLICHLGCGKTKQCR